MLRLAVMGRLNSASRDIQSRLRTAQIVENPEDDLLALDPDDYDAILVTPDSLLDCEELNEFIIGGKHVLLASGACLLSDSLDKLLEIARAAGSQLAVANPERYLASRQAIRQRLDMGSLGEVGLARIHRWQPVDSDADSDGRWPLGLLHDIDLVTWYIGKSPELAYALRQNTHFAPQKTADLVQVHLGFEGGSMALIDFSRVLPGSESYYSLSLIAATGAVYADDHQNVQMFYSADYPRALKAGEGESHWAAIIQEFASSLAAEVDLSSSVTAWLDVLRTADALQRSLDSQQAIPLEAK